MSTRKRFLAAFNTVAEAKEFESLCTITGCGFLPEAIRAVVSEPNPTASELDAYYEYLLFCAEERYV